MDCNIKISGNYTVSGPKVLDSENTEDAEVINEIKSCLLVCLEQAVMEADFNTENYASHYVDIVQAAVAYYQSKGYDTKTGYSLVKLTIGNMTVRAVETPTEEPSENVNLGDVNGDGVINASDAALVLIAAAAMGAGEGSGLTDAQMTVADVNTDGIVNASDAAIILIYAAAVGAGETDAKITDFVH